MRRRTMLSLCGFTAAIAAPAAGARPGAAGMAVAAGHHPGAVRRRRRVRHRGPRHRPAHAAIHRQAGGGREPPGRERRGGRPPVRPERAGRPHADGGIDRRLRHQPRAAAEPRLRPGEAVRARHAGRHHAERAGGESQDRDRHRPRRLPRLAEEEPRQGLVLDQRHRLLRPPDGGAVQAAHRHRSAAHSVCRRRAGHHRPDVGRRAALLPEPRLRPAPRPGGTGSAPSSSPRPSATRSCRRCRRRRRPGCATSSSPPGRR